MHNSFCDRNGNVIDFYTIFNIPYNAKVNDIKTAFRTLIKRYHPDTAVEICDNAMEKIDLIIRGYRILADMDVRRNYDRQLFRNQAPLNESYMVVPNRRVRYSALLSEMLKARLLPRGMKRKDILYNFGQDIEILITGIEAKKGALAYIELPARMYCPLCSGRNPSCHVCRGIGRIHTSSQLEVRIPSGVKNSTLIDIDLIKMKPDRLTTFRGKSIRIRITIIKDGEMTA